MSYLDVANGGTREMDSVRPSQRAAVQSEADKNNQELIQRVFRMATAVKRLKADVGKLGTRADTVAHRKGVADAIARVQDEAQQIKDGFHAMPREQRTRQTAKILSDFEATLKDFQNTMKMARSKEAATLPKAPQPPPLPADALLDLESGEDPQEQMALLQAQKARETAVLENQLQYNEALIDERDQGIAEIQQQIGEVNEIFQDLATLVNDQGQQLDTIESNITLVADRTADAGRDLVRAEHSQRSARNRMCYILLVIGLVLAVLVVVLSL